MKNISISLLFCIPFYVFAQDDYCPCQETNPEYEDIFSFVSSVNTDMPVLLSEATPAYMPSKVEEVSTVVIELPIEIVPEEADEKIEEQEDADLAESQTSTRSSKMKKTKKRFKAKLKKRRKARKYKGKCPIF